MLPDIDWSLNLVTPPSAEPISLTQAKAHLRIDASVTDFDDQIGRYIQAARSFCEESYNVRFKPQTVDLLLSNFPLADRFQVPIRPVRAVQYIKYTTSAQDVLTLDPSRYGTRLNRRPAEVVLKFAQVWPGVVLDTADPVQVRLDVGFERGDSPESLPIPGAAIEAMLMLIGFYYENGSAVALNMRPPVAMVLGVEDLMRSVGLYT